MLHFLGYGPSLGGANRFIEQSTCFLASKAITSSIRLINPKYYLYNYHYLLPIKGEHLTRAPTKLAASSYQIYRGLLLVMKKRHRREILDQLQMNSFRGKANEDGSLAFYRRLVSHIRLVQERPVKINANDFKCIKVV